MTRTILGGGVLMLVLACAPIHAADDVDSLARDVERLTSLRTVKDLQRSYAQLAQFGQWRAMAALFTSDATFISGAQTAEGSCGHRGCTQARRADGLAPGALNTELIDEPLVNLSLDGRSAKGRWMSLSLLGDGKGKARIEGGVYENEYRREGKAWKISVAHYYPQFAGDYETGWTNIDGADLPLVPFHFTVDETGMPVPQPSGTAPRSSESLASLARQIDRLNDEDAVRNLQHAYGYYVDRKMWDDVVDLFAEDSAVMMDDALFRGPWVCARPWSEWVRGAPAR